MSNMHEVVISGISGRFPECCGLDEFRKKLFSCSNLQKDDTSRFNLRLHEHDTPFTTGKIPDWNRFDATFFGVSPKQVRSCDPLLGLYMETSFEAMMDAGVNPYAMKGRNISVVSTSSLSDAEALRITDSSYVDGLGMIGHSKTMLANRISYCFNFHGPSYNCDNSWTSSIQGLVMAASIVASGTVEAAIVTSCNLISCQTQDLEYKELGMLSPDGRSLSFDDQAKGFSRSEGAVSVFIQRASDAKRNYCSIIKADNSYLGNKSCSFVGIDPQVTDFFNQFYGDLKVQPSDVSYIEAHGLAKREVDAQELNTLANIFTSTSGPPVLVGSVSGNVGNCECPKGLVSLAKVIIAMETGVIPPTIGYQTPNRQVAALASGRIVPVSKPTPLPGDLVGINAISLTGSVSHVLVKRNPKAKNNGTTNNLSRLVLLQARHEEGAHEILKKISTMTINEELASLVNDVFKVPIPAYLWRGYAIFPNNDSAITTATQLNDSTKRPVWFVFSGMGSQWVGMGRDLMTIPVFSAAIDRCDRVLRPKGLDLKHILTTDNPEIFDNILNCFVGIAAVQVGLVDILKTVGVTPDGMIGHSVGELGCAYADGCLTAEQMVLASYARGRASLESDQIQGMMAAVGLGYNDIKSRLPPTIDVACRNSNNSCTLSGPAEDVGAFVEVITQEGVFAKLVSAGGIAYHSRRMRHIGPNLLRYLENIIPEPKVRSSRWVSSSVPESQWNTRESQLCSAEYHTNNLLSPVLFEEASRHVPKNTILIEIAPTGLLQAILKRSVTTDCLTLSLTSHTVESNVNHLLQTIGQLFLNNVDVDVNTLYPPVTHPISRGNSNLASLITWDHSTVCYQEFSQTARQMVKHGSAETILFINPEDPDYGLWNDRKINGEPFIPITQLLESTWDFMFQIRRQQFEHEAILVEDCVFSNHLPLQPNGQELLISSTPVGLKFELNVGQDIFMERNTIATGKSKKLANQGFNKIFPPKDLMSMEEVGGSEVYAVLARFGLYLGKPLRVVKHLMVGNKECYGKIQWTGNLSVFLDGLFHIITFLQVEEHQRLVIPTSFKKLVVNIPFFNELTPGSTVDVLYDFPCERVVCKGAELQGVTFTSAFPAKSAAISWSELKLQALTDKLPLQEFVQSCIQLAATNSLSSWRPRPSPVHILVIADVKNQHAIFCEYFSHLSNMTPHFKVNITEVSLDKAKEQVLSHPRHTFVLAGGLHVLSALEDYVASQNIYILVNATENGKVISNTKFLPIMENHTEGVKLAFLRVRKNINEAKIYEMRGSDWLSGLRELMAGDDLKTPVIVVSTSQHPREFLPQLAMEPYADRVRSFCIMDNDAPRFSISCQLYRDQLSLGLSVNILSGGRWSSLNIIGLDLTHKKTFHSQCCDPALDIHFVGFNTTNVTLDLNKNEFELNVSPSEMKHVDYSGLQDGLRVMGVGQLDPFTNTLTPDPTLRWTVPAGWTMEEAATVPVVYTLVSYNIVTLSQTP